MLSVGFSLVLGILLAASPGILGDCPYAKFSPEHTACLPPSPTCKIIQRGVSEQEKELILKLHNQYRSNVSTGHEIRAGGMPQASNMLELIWDDELAALAQLHAEQCEVEHECNECRQVERFSVGQNLFYAGDNIRPTSFDWDSLMLVFYDEVAYFNKGLMKPYVYEESYGHFTQLVWGTSRYVGCGSIIANETGFYNSIYVCNFGPAGNDIGGEMYKVGATCSACPSGTPTCTVSGQGSYEGLCGASNINSSPTMTIASSTVPPPKITKAPAPPSTKAPTPSSSKAPVPPSTQTPTQQKYETPAQIVHETPEAQHYEVLDQVYYEEPYQYYEKPEQVYYEAPNQYDEKPEQVYYEAPNQYYDKSEHVYIETIDQYYEKLGQYYEKQDQMSYKATEQYETPGQVYYGPAQQNYGLPGNMMYQVQYW